ncbi:MAG TPA: hypothetical protein VFX98_10920, partial [Longimicrobiaceae bacterium]|nr:hypothetical protein [Longimicrobiaceae bacterium]
MRPYLLVAGDFVRTGGMDYANHALAAFLARSGRAVHLVTHRADPELAALPGVQVHPVPRPLGSHLLGFPLLDRAGRRWAVRLAPERPVVLANGGNCRAGDASWLHYVHAAYDPDAHRALHPPHLSGRKALRRWSRRRALADERAAVRR